MPATKGAAIGSPPLVQGYIHALAALEPHDGVRSVVALSLTTNWDARRDAAWKAETICRASGPSWWQTATQTAEEVAREGTPQQPQVTDTFARALVLSTTARFAVLAMATAGTITADEHSLLVEPSLHFFPGLATHLWYILDQPVIGTEALGTLAAWTSTATAAEASAQLNAVTAEFTEFTTAATAATAATSDLAHALLLNDAIDFVAAHSQLFEQFKKVVSPYSVRTITKGLAETGNKYVMAFYLMASLVAQGDPEGKLAKMPTVKEFFQTSVSFTWVSA